MHLQRTIGNQGVLKGVHMVLQFHPFPDKVDATKIALVQTVKRTKEGKAWPKDLTSKERTTASGYTIDAREGENNPLYGENPLGAGKGLKDTEETVIFNYENLPEEEKKKEREKSLLKVDQNFQLGACYPRGNPIVKDPAGLADSPGADANIKQEKEFETAAIALDGKDPADV